MKIPTLESNVAPGNAQVPYLPGQFAQAASPNLDMAANAIAKYGQMQARDQAKVQMQEEKDARYWASIQGSTLRKETADHLASATQNMPKGGEGFAGSVDAFIGTRAEQIKKQAPSQLATDLWDVESANIRSQMFSHTIQTEAQERARFKGESISKSIVEDSATLYQEGHRSYFTPDASTSPFKMMRDEKIGIIEESGLPTQVKQQLTQSMDKEWTQSYLYNQLNNGPKQLLEDLKSGKTIDYLTKVGITPDQQMLQSFRATAENIVKTSDNQNIGEVRRYMDNNLSSISLNGREINPPFDNDTMVKAVGVDTWKAYEDKKYVATQTRQAAELLISDPSPENVKAVLTQYKNRADGMQTSKNADVYQSLAKSWSDIASTLIRDGHTAAMDALRGADVQMMVGGVVHTNDAIARSAFSIEYQKRAGVPEELIRILTVEEAKAHVNKLAQIDPANAEAYLSGLQENYGPYYQQVFRQINQSGLPNGYKVSLWAGGTAMSDVMTNVARRSTKDMEEATGLMAPDLRNIKDSVTAEIKPFVNTITYGDSAGTRTDYVTAMYDTMYKAVLAQVASGMTIKEAVTSVKKTLIDDRYYIKGTYWIPKTITEPNMAAVGKDGWSKATSENKLVPVDESIIEDKLDANKNNIAKFNPTNRNIFRSKLIENDNKAILLEAIKRDSYWLVTEDGSGVYLALTSNGMKGVPVVNSKGQRYEFKWRNLYRPGPTAEGKITRPDFGDREDGTKKGAGWLGVLTRKDDPKQVSTEISITVGLDGKEVLIPTLVPTLTKSEIDYMLTHDKPTKAIVDKAVEHAKKRMKEGKSPFKD